MDDVRYAFRQLRAHPAFAVVAVATLAIGIGSASAMFGLIQGVLLSPPPYAEPDRLVLVTPVRVDGQPYERGAIGRPVAGLARARGPSSGRRCIAGPSTSSSAATAASRSAAWS